MLVRLARRCILAVATLVLAGCSDPLGPSDVSGTYVLTRVGSGSLPIARTFSDGSMLRIEADSVVLRADGTGYQHSVQWFTPAGGIERRSAGPEEFTYRMDGLRVLGRFDEGADAISHTFEFVVVGDELLQRSVRYERRTAH